MLCPFLLYDLVYSFSLPPIASAVGFWAGWSILTVFQFGEFLSDLIVVTCRRKKCVTTEGNERSNRSSRDRKGKNLINGKQVPVETQPVEMTALTEST